MAKISQGVPIEELPNNEELHAPNSKAENQPSPSCKTMTKRNIIGLLIALAAIALIIGLSVGLTRGKQDVTTTTATSSSKSPNLDTFDIAAELLDSNPLLFKDLNSGETMSYREYNMGQPNVLVAIPGFFTDDSMYSILATLPQFADHHIIAVNPIGWNGSSRNTPIWSHEENADKVMELLALLNIESAMAMGYSTGGGIAFHMAHNYPDIINASFLIHSIPLHGLKFFTASGEQTVLNSLEEAEEMLENIDYPSFEDPVVFNEFFKSMSSNPTGFIPSSHKLNTYFHEAALGFIGPMEIGYANMAFNVSPIQTPYSSPSDYLSTLESKVVVVHGSPDTVVPGQIVEHLTKLAIVDQWAPANMLSFYDDGEGHMLLFDNPHVFGEIYRKALEEQILE
jgi:pimeloyl-ACP methyl ester carboxylesterase